MTDANQPQPSTFSVLASLISTSAPHLGALGGSVLSSVLAQVAASGKEAGEATARAAVVVASHEREVLARVAEAVAAGESQELAKARGVIAACYEKIDRYLARIQALEAGSERVAYQARKAVEGLSVECKRLESLVSSALDAPATVGPTAHESFLAVVSFLNTESVTEVTEGDAAVIAGWADDESLGVRWSVCRWVEVGRIRGHTMPPELRSLVDNLACRQARPQQNVADKAVDAVDAVDEPSKAMRVYERIRLMGANTTPQQVSSWRDAWIDDAIAWIEEGCDLNATPSYIAALFPDR